MNRLWSRIAVPAAALFAGAAIWQLASLKTNTAFLASFTGTIARVFE
jgi:hypothetical protein